MLIKFDKIYENADEMKEDLTSPFNTAALFVHAIASYRPDNEDNFYNMFKKLIGEAQEVSNFDRSFIKEQMAQGEKWKYIGKSYFVGATPENDYTPNEPLTIEIKENPYSYQEEGYARLLLNSGGTDNDRFITLRKMKDGRYVIWSDSYKGILSGIREPESSNPWA